jgi:hypothetical protein
MTSIKVRFLRGERVLSSEARMVAFAITSSARRRFTWGGAIALGNVPPAELAVESADGLLIELTGGQGGRFPIVVQRRLGALLAQFRGTGPRPPGIC